MYSDILAKRVRELKETQKGVESMCREMDQIYKEGREEGKMETKRENAISMAELGMSIDQIAKVVKENVEIVQKWIADGIALTK